MTMQGRAVVPVAETGVIGAGVTDGAGRLLRYNSPHGELTLVWNSAAQLAQLRRGENVVAQYRYDAQGRRISKTVLADPASSRQFIYSGGQLVAEADARGAVLRQYIYLGARPVAWIEPAQTLLQRVRQYLFGPTIVYLHTDHRGAVTAATGSGQAILWQADVNTFGNAGAADGESDRFEQRLRLAGQYADRESGQHYNLARYYDSRGGAFISPDPAGLTAGSLDLYAYADGDPLNFFDPRLKNRQ